MLEKVPRTLIALAVLFLPTMADYHVQPAYQVTIMLEFQRGNPIHLCNGCIVYERLIATTANCVHFRFGPEGKPTLLEPSALSVWAGSSNGLRHVLRVNISAINVAAGFNAETLENDLALLTLSQSLPLGERQDMRWIMLDDKVHVNHSCLVNFFSRNSKSTIPNYYKTEKLFLYNNEICRNSTTHPMARESDLCSRYVLPHQFNCDEADSFLSFNNDRGSGLVCKNYLVGLLSSVVTRPDPKNNCSGNTLTAMYTNIFPHLMWVYSVMTNIETKFISTPYNASLNAVIGETAKTLRDYRENEIVPTTTFLPPPQVSVSILISPTASPSSTTITSAPVTEGSAALNSTEMSPTVIKERSLPSIETTPSGGEDRTIALNSSVPSSHSTEGTVPTLPSTTVLPPLGGNSTNRMNSTIAAICPTLPAGEEFLEKSTGEWTVSTVHPTTQLQSTNATSSTASFTTTNPTFATNNFSTTADLINSTIATNFTTSSPVPETTTSQPLGTTESAGPIHATFANETIVVSEISTPTNIPATQKSPLSENASGLTNATESNAPEATATTLNTSNTLSPYSHYTFYFLTTSTTGSPLSAVLAGNTTTNATKGLNSTDTLVTEVPSPASNSTTLPSPSSLISHASLTNITADISSEEDISNVTTTANPVEIYPTLGSDEDATDRRSNSSSTPSPLRKSLNPTPTTETAPSPTLAQMKWNYTMLRPLPTVQLEPIKESVERFFRSSATSSHLNAFSLLIAFLLFKLIF